jgi:folate-binding protein YgfZ
MKKCFGGLDGSWGQVSGMELLLEGPNEKGLYKELREKKGLLLCDHLGTLKVHGKDAADYLQRMTSQDCLGMEPGFGGPACLLTGKGKLIAFFNVFREEPDSFLIMGQRELMGTIREHLDLFHFREEMTIGEVRHPFMLGFFGREARSTCSVAGEYRLEEKGVIKLFGLGDWVVPGCLLLGQENDLRSYFDSFIEEGHPYGGFQAWEGLRIDSRLPRYGVDADLSNIPLEVRLDSACHSDKGCYVGQEVVARIRNLGHVNRLLCLLRGEAEVVPSKDSLLFDEDLEAGRVTSAFRVPGKEEVHVLALLPRVLSGAGTQLCLGQEGGPIFEVRDPE